MDPVSIVVAALGGAALLSWLAAVSWVWRRRPAREVRDALLRALPDVCDTLDAIAVHDAVDPLHRARARRASRYVSWPIDLLPDGLGSLGRVDDLVFALEAIRRVHDAHGLELLEQIWTGDELGWHALRAGLGLPASWDPSTA